MMRKTIISTTLIAAFALSGCGGGDSAEENTGPNEGSQETATLTGEKIGTKKIFTQQSTSSKTLTATSITIQTNESGLVFTLLKNSQPTVNNLTLDTLSITVTSINPLFGAIPTEAINNGGNCYLPTTQQLPSNFKTCRSMGIDYSDDGLITFDNTNFSAITGNVGTFTTDGSLTFKKP
jgi:hypothetical protein